MYLHHLHEKINKANNVLQLEIGSEYLNIEQLEHKE